MKILHTSDWHLGRNLYGRSCHREFQEFLNWLIEQINLLRIDYLLISGDIFDSFYPSNSTLKLYYSFLHNISKSYCRHVVITAGNHDSPALLHAPKQLLEQLNISIVAQITDAPEDEIIVLDDTDGKPEIIICAVPFLRDKDIRRSDIGESYEDKAEKLVSGIEKHYYHIASAAKEIQGNRNLPIIGMGHLFTAGGQISDTPEIRDLYVGSLAHIHPARLPKDFDYLALGHLHTPQFVGDNSKIRYSGSPLQLSFTRENSGKSVTLVNCGDSIEIEDIPVPSILPLKSLTGAKEALFEQLKQLLEEDNKLLVEIIFEDYASPEIIDELENLVSQSKVEIIRIKRHQLSSTSASTTTLSEKLEDLKVTEVFQRCLQANTVKDEMHEELTRCFEEILSEVQLSSGEEE